ncbi:VPLPA-CTERM sorting domain-containing protein [Rhodovulum iodosum]|nr:VPLPA-CTERM sorting domain-containing protein [Rhodovulum robiginosum]
MLCAGLALSALPAAAVEVQWIDWITAYDDEGVYTVEGVITSGSETIDVTYTNAAGVGFVQTGTGTDYFTASGPDSPYTSVGPNGVDNRPPAAEMIALRYAGVQTLTFSQTVENLYYSFVSMNGNGYRFDQDFEILSYTGGNVDGQGTDDAGYWGSGGVVKVDNGDGTYSLNATGGEPHGTIFFDDTFDSLTWASLTNEYWNGFTIGVQGTDEQVGEVPLPAGGVLLLSGLAGAVFVARRKRAKT